MRLSIQVEEDNSVLRDLQYLQASMIWLDIGVFCGYTRKMQIAESYLQPLCTVSRFILEGFEFWRLTVCQAVRRGAAFDRSTYTTITPYTFGNDDESIHRAWHAWVRQESLKRYAYEPNPTSFKLLNKVDLCIICSAMTWKSLRR